MTDLWHLISDNTSVTGELVSTVALVMVAAFGAAVAVRLAARSTTGPRA